MSESLRHDIRGALQVVRLAVEQVRQGHPDAAEALESVEDALDAVADVIRSGDDTVDLAAAVPRWMQQLQPALSHATVEVEVSGAPAVTANSVRVQRVVQNLVLNAARHAGPRPVIRLAWDDGLVVEDDGPGFEARSHGGLASVERLVQEDGGSLQRAGPGTRWFVRWPVGP